MTSETTPQAAHGPLGGYRVLELSSTVAGPFCGRLFADFGAEVIKIEPLEGDFIRSVGRQHKGASLYATSILRNRRLVALDLRKPEGQAIVRALAAKSDFLVENFRPGALEGWGLGYEALVRENPRLIMVRISGYGQSGPYSKKPGYGIICEALGGLRHLNGDPDRPPARMAISLTDFITGLYAFGGAMVALDQRHRSGRGQVVDAALYESAFSLMEQHIGAYDQLGVVAGRLGSATGSAPNNLYPTRDARWIHIAANGPAVFRRFAQVIERQDMLDDPRYANPRVRSQHHEAVDAIVSGWTCARDLTDIEHLLDQAEVPAMRIYTLADIFADPHYAAREAIARVPDATLGSVAMAAPVPRLSETPARITASGGAVGRDTEWVLHELLGLPEAEIARLAEAGVVGAAPATGAPE